MHTAPVTFETYNAVTTLKADYFRFLDAKRWDELSELFTPDATFEGYAFDGGNNRKNFVSALSSFLSDVQSQHQGFMPRMKHTDEGTLRASWAMHDYLTWAPESRVYKGIEVPGMHGIRGYGFYEDEYTLTNQGWRISFSRLTRTRIDALTGTPPVTPNYDVRSPSTDW